MREIVLDTETTGLNPKAGHRLVEIGCVELVDRVVTGAQFHRYLNPERDMPEEAEHIHGLSSKFLADQPLFVDIVDKLSDFLADGTLVIHNAEFDMSFLNAELKWANRKTIKQSHAIDTLAMARQKFPGAKNNLDALCKRFRIDNSHRSVHGALRDAVLLAEVYLDLTGSRKQDLGLEEAMSHPGMHRGESVESRPKELAPRQTEEDFKKHWNMTEEKLGKNSVWRKYPNPFQSRD